MRPIRFRHPECFHFFIFFFGIIHTGKTTDFFNRYAFDFFHVMSCNCLQKCFPCSLYVSAFSAVRYSCAVGMKRFDQHTCKDE